MKQTRLEEDSGSSGSDANATAVLFPSFLILQLQPTQRKRTKVWSTTDLQVSKQLTDDPSATYK